MEKDKIIITPYSPERDDGYNDDDIPQIDLPETTDIIPDEVPRRDGPGGE